MGPLNGLTVIELAGIGPGPFCGMMLADMGARVIRVERPASNLSAQLDPLARNRESIVCDLKNPAAVEVVLRLVENADAIFEGFRPGVVENLGLAPGDCLARNPAIVYGRVTGWGQEGPLAQTAGHDMNYLSLTGALHLIGEQGGKPVPPLNLVGDFGGGGLLLAFGMLAAILNAKKTGKGQVVDAAMVDGANVLMAFFHGLNTMGLGSEDAGSSFLGGAAHFYDTYEAKDGKYLSVAPIEPQFYAEFIEKAGLDIERFGPHVFNWQTDPETRQNWRELKAEIAARLKTRTRDEWVAVFSGTDACVAPVLTMSEALQHPHNLERETFCEVGGHTQPAPAPRFSATPSSEPAASVKPGTNTRDVLRAAAFSEDKIEELIAAGN